MLRTSNPVLKSKSFGGFASQVEAPASDVRQQTMTIRGTVDKTAILLALVMVAGLWPWKLMAVDPAAAMSWLWIGLVGGLVDDGEWWGHARSAFHVLGPMTPSAVSPCFLWNSMMEPISLSGSTIGMPRICRLRSQ